mgnify:FL=1
MSKFNNKQGITTVTYEGGEAYEKPLLHEWLNILFGSFLAGGAYESDRTQAERLIEKTRQIADKYGAEFAMKAVVYARNVMGMRSASHLAGAVLNAYNFQDKRDLYRKLFHRPDDVAELFGAIDYLYEKRSHAVVMATCDYVSGMNEYMFGKYKLTGKRYNWFDIINISHANSTVIDTIKTTGKIPVADVWETAISNTDNAEEEWKRLLVEGKLGYLALLRNLRNISKYDFCTQEFAEKYIFSILCDPNKIKESLVFPFQIYTAYKACPKYWYELSEAFKASMENVPVIEGSTLVAVDVSGSMDAGLSLRSTVSIGEASACYAYIVSQRCTDPTIVKFGSTASLVSRNILDNYNPFDAIEDIAMHTCGYSTCIGEIRKVIGNKKFDRLFLFSDQQNMEMRNFDMSSPVQFVNSISKYSYSFDLGAYPTTVFKDMPSNVCLMTCLTTNLFALVRKFEEGEDALYNEINDMRNWNPLLA